MKKNIQSSQDNLNSNHRLYSGYNDSKSSSCALNHVYDNEVWSGDNCYVSTPSNKAYNVSIRNYYPTSTSSNARTLKLS